MGKRKGARTLMMCGCGYLRPSQRVTEYMLQIYSAESVICNASLPRLVLSIIRIGHGLVGLMLG